MKKLTKNDKRKKYKDKLQKRQELMVEEKSQKKKKEKVEKRESIVNIDSQEPNIKIKRKVNKKKLALILIIVIAVCVYLTNAVYHLIKNPTDSVMVSEGSISQEETVEGYVIRDETVIKGENYKNGMVEIKSEGSKVASGDPIFRYYSSGEDDLKAKIADLDTKIQEAMEANNQNLFSPDTKLLDTQIETKLEQVTKTNDIQKIKEYKKSITENITKKAKIAGDLSPTGSYLKKLIDERSGYENELN